jgi:DNA-directed RNA polymerase specialized sigma24 family protein
MAEMTTSGATVEALESLYQADFPRFVRAAAAIVGDEGAGRDVVQEAFAQAIRKRTSFKGEAPLEAWVWRVVINEALALRRRSVPELEGDSECGVHAVPDATSLRPGRRTD